MVSSRIGKVLAGLLMAAVALSCDGPKDKLIKIPTPPRPAGQEDMIGFAAEPLDTVRIGFIGLGQRGPGAVKRMARIEGTKIVALCDYVEENVKKCQVRLTSNGRPEAAEYFGEDCWRKMMDRDDINLVYISTDWASHAWLAVYAMEHGKHVVVEVPGCTSLDECWQLINTSERTRKHCMMLENCCYDFFELTALNMAQQGLFGEIVHAEGAYIHTLTGWDNYWNNWRMEFNRNHRGDVYPTHGLGPICQALNIHRGDRMTRLVSMDTRSFNGKAQWEEKNGPIPEGEPDFQNGDMTMTMIYTEKGKSMLIEHDVMNPRPYNRLYALTGTKGYANKYPVPGFLIQGDDLEEAEIDIENLEAHKYVPEEVREQLMEKYKHPITRDLEENARKVGGHGGMDYMMDYRLVYCLRNGLPLDMDVYDLAEWSCIGELSRISLEHGCAPVEVPDFTRGGWNKIQGYRHAFVGQ